MSNHSLQATPFQLSMPKSNQCFRLYSNEQKTEEVYFQNSKNVISR